MPCTDDMDELDLLRSWLEKMAELGPDEVIVLVDPGKRTKVIEVACKHAQYDADVRVEEVPYKGWRMRVAELVWHGFAAARHDIVYASSVDEWPLPEAAAGAEMVSAETPLVSGGFIIEGRRVKAGTGCPYFIWRPALSNIDADAYSRIVNGADSFLFSQFKAKGIGYRAAGPDPWSVTVRQPVWMRRWHDVAAGIGAAARARAVRRGRALRWLWQEVRSRRTNQRSLWYIAGAAAGIAASGRNRWIVYGSKVTAEEFYYAGSDPVRGVFGARIYRWLFSGGVGSV